MVLEIGESFRYDQLEWSITTIILGPNQQVIKFKAMAFNGRYYETREFNVSQNEQRKAG